MRFFRLAALAVTATSVLVVACTVEEAPNPPATRNGTEPTEPSGPPSLPPESNPSQKPTYDAAVPDAKAADSGTTLPNGPTSGVDPTKTLGSLSTSEKKTLCDWQAGINGGYGRTATCEGGLSASYPKSQSACLAKFPPASCQATVADAEACFHVDAKDPCAFAIFTAAECAALRACAM